MAERQDPLIYRPVPKFPGIDFDLALQVSSDTDAGKLESTLRATAGTDLNRFQPFDVFEGEIAGRRTKEYWPFRLRFIDEAKNIDIRMSIVL